jgi:hypothetical protein
MIRISYTFFMRFRSVLSLCAMILHGSFDENRAVWLWFDKSRICKIHAECNLKMCSIPAELSDN